MLTLPVYDPAESPYSTPAFAPGDDTADEDTSAVTWRTSRDVLARITSAFVEHGGEPYDTPHGRAGEHYVGEVSVQTQTFAQSARSDVTFSLHYDDDGVGAPVDCVAHSLLQIEADDTDLDVTIELTCTESGPSGERVVGQRSWHRRFPRDLA
jgi:hypothetical protein